MKPRPESRWPPAAQTRRRVVREPNLGPDVVGFVPNVACLEPHASADEGEAVGPLPAPPLPRRKQIGRVVVPWKIVRRSALPAPVSLDPGSPPVSVVLGGRHHPRVLLPRGAPLARRARRLVAPPEEVLFEPFHEPLDEGRPATALLPLEELTGVGFHRVQGHARKGLGLQRRALVTSDVFGGALNLPHQLQCLGWHHRPSVSLQLGPQLGLLSDRGVVQTEARRGQALAARQRARKAPRKNVMTECEERGILWQRTSFARKAFERRHARGRRPRLGKAGHQVHHRARLAAPEPTRGPLVRIGRASQQAKLEVWLDHGLVAEVDRSARVGHDEKSLTLGSRGLSSKKPEKTCPCCGNGCAKIS
mmetsp:Transcript_32428/g.73303  ORF Transcript_32428/g.73303 Transcript_32428/m.73303 type:complete len:363 (+) Transcript_32428:277-1365(+)